MCLGLPGALPLVNEQAVEYAVRAGLALNCEINHFSRFDRKNYFYPDLPKAYQITQDVFPICTNGYLEYYIDDVLRRTTITRLHLEEEAGKLVHSSGSIVDSEYSLVDYNRAGIPLIEIVTAPDITSPRQARLFLEQLRLLMLYMGVSDTKMEEGSLRCDANISLKPAGSTVLGTKVEIKNLNSFRALERALEYEAARQSRVLEQGERLSRRAGPGMNDPVGHCPCAPKEMHQITASSPSLTCRPCDWSRIGFLGSERPCRSVPWNACTGWRRAMDCLATSQPSW